MRRSKGTEPAEPAAGPPPGGGFEPRASVLLVDDEEANLLALEAILDPLGVRLVKARSGAEALQRVLG